MTRMKWLMVLTLAIGAIFAAAVVANAQGGLGRCGTGRAGFGMHRGAGMMHRGAGMMQCGDRLGLTAEQKTKARAIFETARKESQAVFTPEQQAQMKAFRAQRQAPPTLNLTDAQKTQMQAIRQDIHAQIQKVRAEAKLSREEQGTQIRSIVQSAHQRMQQVLTPEQQQQMAARHQGPFAKLNLTDAQQAQLKGIREKAEAAFRAILTPDQQTKCDACRAQCEKTHQPAAPQAK